MITSFKFELWWVLWVTLYCDLSMYNFDFKYTNCTFYLVCVHWQDLKFNLKNPSYFNPKFYACPPCPLARLKKIHVRLKNLSQYTLLKSLCIPYDKLLGGKVVKILYRFNKTHHKMSMTFHWFVVIRIYHVQLLQQLNGNIP